MTARSPSVSICIPTYNGAAYLRDCLESVLAQSDTDLEVVVVDDCSTDETQAILGRYRERDGRVRLFHNPRNLGLVGNWNECIARARGEWIKFVFQDDWLAPDCVARMVAEARATGTLLTVCRRRFAFAAVSDEFRARYRESGDEGSLAVIAPGRRVITAQEFCEAILERGVVNFIGEPTAALIHRDAFREFGRFDPKLIQLCDIEYWFRLGVQRGIGYIPEVLAYFRVHEDSATFRNWRERSFHGNIIDPLLIQCELAFNPVYQPLRDAAAQRGRDLRAEFAWASVVEQCWGKAHANPGWRQVLAAEPRLRMPWRLRVRRLVRHTLERIGVL